MKEGGVGVGQLGWVSRRDRRRMGRGGGAGWVRGRDRGG